MRQNELKQLLQNDVTIKVEIFVRNSHYYLQHNEQNFRLTEKQYEFVKNNYELEIFSHNYSGYATIVYKILNKKLI